MNVRRPVMLLRVVGALLAMVMISAGLLTGGAAPAQAAPYDSIAGSGSTWSQIMIDQWVRDVKKNGLPVSYTGNGSSAGRSDYYQGLNDFAESEIPFQTPGPAGGTTVNEVQLAARRPYAYLPIVAGGTSFMYHLTVGGQRVTNLRLSGETLTKIFTGVITNWSDPAITRDNGRTLPNRTITPVIRSDGSGTSAQFTLYMSRRYPALWSAFCAKYANQNGNCGLQSIYPQFGNAKGQPLSSGVANYVSASYGEGAITYVEYSYAQKAGYPVASILNAGGYYVQPTAGNVAVALTKAVIQQPSLTQNLDGVYADTDPRTYPVSSYSYMIVPIAIAGRFTAGKGRTLTTFMSYFLCAGQQEAANLGFSPLPINLVQAGFDQLRRVPGAVSPPSIASCDNPALKILTTAPYPPACAKAGAAPCGSTGGGSTSAQGGGGSGGGAGGSGGTAGSTGGGTGSGANGGAGATGARSESTGGTTVDPVTGQVVSANGGPATAGGNVSAVPVSVSGLRQGGGGANVLYVLAATELLLVLFVPPFMSRYLRRRRSGL